MKKLITSLLSTLTIVSAFGQGQTQVLTENFNGTAIPVGWSQNTVATDGGWNFGTAASLSSAYFPIPSPGSNIAATNDDDCNCNKAADWLITSPVDLTTYSSVHVSFKMYYTHSNYQGAQENAALLYSTDNGTTWTTAKDFTTGSGSWQNVYVDVSAAAMNDSVLFAVRYGDGGGWTYGMAIDDFAVYIPYNYDFTTESLNLYPTQGLNNAPFTFSGAMVNVGSQTVNAFNVNYLIGGSSTVHTTAVTGANVASFGTYQYTTSSATAWTPSAAGTYTIKIWASSLDGSADQNSLNDTLSTVITIVPQTVQRQVLVEEFTSSTCPPCASFNAVFTPILNANNPNTANGKVNVVKYQMNWPSPGTDPNYNQDGNTRKNYYGVSGVPTPFIDANEGYSSQIQIDGLYQIPAMVDISGSWTYSGMSAYVIVDVNPKVALPSTAKLRIAVVEKQIKVSDFPGYQVTNGETQFEFVMRKMLPNAAGTGVSSFPVNTTSTVSENYGFTLGSVAQNNSNIWYGMDVLEVVAWIQDDADKSILQSSTITANGIGINEFEAFATALKIYPNPANTQANIAIELKDDAVVSFSLVNSLGQTVLSKSQKMFSGYNEHAFDISNLAVGIYMMNIEINGISKTQRVAITR